MNFLSVLSLMFAHTAMIHRFYPEQKMALNVIENRSDSCDFERSPIVGNSGAIGRVLGLVEQISGMGTNVLTIGESGVGKEFIADAIHRNIPRRDKPLINVNCAALPETLLESELFGHEKGVFSGSHAIKKDGLSKPKALLYFLTKSATFLLKCKSSCFGCCKIPN